MATDFDAVVIGSGFGGAVTACRLAEKGMRVLILERGRHWRPETYPRRPEDPWIWSQSRPEKHNGWLDLRMFPGMAVAQGAAVGGGSLIYANVSIEAKPEVFRHAFPPEITYQELAPHYARVGEMLGATTIPEAQATQRYRLMRDAARATGFEARFRPVPLAVTFDPEWRDDLPDAHDERHSRRWVNAHGEPQGTCVHCGNCDIGCQVQAKNTLDLNYLPRALQHGAELRPLHLVTCIEPADGGYRVRYDELRDGRRQPGSVRAERVVLAAGSLASTELLLRCRDEFGTLRQLSPRLGHSWSSNGDFLTPAVHRDRRVSPTRGPTITCAIDFLDGGAGGDSGNERFFIEDGGFPDVLGNHLEAARKTWLGRLRHAALYRTLGQLIRARDPVEHVMPWFAQGIDAGDGQLGLGRPWWRPWRRELTLKWDIRRSEGVVRAIVAMHEKLSRATGGEPCVPITWKWFKNLVTPHPLGGCNLGTGPDRGVVAHTGEVFGHRHLYVADGAIVPAAVGLNPSRTIAALAERIAALMR